MKATAENLIYLANGLVEGVLIPEKGLLISADGMQYGCTISPKLKAWFERHPDKAGEARAFVVYPRTLKGNQVQFHVVGAPNLNPEQIKTGSGVFRVQGVVTNLRGERNHTVVRIKRNGTPSIADRRNHAWDQHLIFLSGRVTPSELFVGNFVNFTCRLVGNELQIQGAHPLGGPSLEWARFGAAYLPWPFNPRKTSTWAQFRRKNATGSEFAYLGRERLSDVVADKLHQLRKLVQSLKRSDRFNADATFNRDVDRLRLIHDRLDKFASRSAHRDLELAVEKEGLLRMLNLVLAPDPGGVDAPKAQPKAKSKSTPPPAAKSMPTTALALSPVHKKIHKAMSLGMLDERVMLALDVGRDSLRDAIKAMDAAGMLDDGSLKAARSYQLKRYQKQKSATSAQLAAV